MIINLFLFIIDNLIETLYHSIKELDLKI